MKKLPWIALALVSFGLAPTVTWAADARDYIPAPPGTALAIMYFQHTTGHEMYSDGDKTADFNVSANVGIFRPVYYVKVGPFVVDPQALIPFANQHVDGAGVGGAQLMGSGLADPVLLATVWFLNDAASKTWFGFTPYLWLPIGEYDKDNAINIGENRWKGRAEFGFVKGLGDKTYVDLVAYYQVFGNNSDYGPGSDTLKQKPLVGLEAHLSYDVTKSFFVAADYFYTGGGKTKVDGGGDWGDRQSNHSWQGTLGFALAPGYQLLLQYKNDFSVESGAKTDTFGTRFLYAF